MFGDILTMKDDEVCEKKFKQLEIPSDIHRLNIEECECRQIMNRARKMFVELVNINTGSPVNKQEIFSLCFDVSYRIQCLSFQNIDEFLNIDLFETYVQKGISRPDQKI